MMNLEVFDEQLLYKVKVLCDLGYTETEIKEDLNLQSVITVRTYKRIIKEVEKNACV
jgi:hypothetical protein